MSWIREKHLSMVLMQLSSLTRGGAEGTKLNVTKTVTRQCETPELRTPGEWQDGWQGQGVLALGTEQVQRIV